MKPLIPRRVKQWCHDFLWGLFASANYWVVWVVWGSTWIGQVSYPPILIAFEMSNEIDEVHKSEISRTRATNLRASVLIRVGPMKEVFCFYFLVSALGKNLLL